MFDAFQGGVVVLIEDTVELLARGSEERGSSVASLRSEYLAAHTARDIDAALRAFSVTGSVTDEGQTFRSTEEILRFLSKAGADSVTPPS